MHHVISTFLILLVGLGAWSAKAQTLKEWTIFIYMNADNNLEPDAIENINQMEEVGSSENVNIVVQICRSPRYDFSNGNWTGTRRFLLTKDDDPLTISSEPLKWPCEPAPCEMPIETQDDLGDVDTYRKAIDWLISTYPARRYAVIFWGHGRGWKSEPEPKLFKGLEASERSGKRISTAQLAESLAYTANKIGRPLDLVVFDSCNMQMTEIAFELAQYAALMVGSEDIVPPDGIPYNKVLAALAANPKMPTSGFARVIAEEYNQHYRTISSTISVLDLNAIAGLAVHLEELAQVILQNERRSEHLRSAYNNSLKFHFADFIDLGRFLDLIGMADPTYYEAAARRAKDQLVGSVIYNRTTGPDQVAATGLSIYFPQPRLFDAGYGLLKIGGLAPTWLLLLQDYANPEHRNIFAELDTLMHSTPEMLKIPPERYQYEAQKLGRQLITLRNLRGFDPAFQADLKAFQANLRFKHSLPDAWQPALR